MSYMAPRGTVDVLPEESTIWQFTENKIRELCSLYAYKEIRTPIFELTELFKRGVGETTDIVEKEMYTLLDKGGRSLTLRPEGTASVVRAFIQNKMFAQNPLTKLFYFGPMFRYERPQAGRLRQFSQFGVEVFGTNSAELDSEIIELGMTFFNSLGITSARVDINSIGNNDTRLKYKEMLIQYLESYKNDLTDQEQSRLKSNPLRILDSKVGKTKEILQEAPSILNCLDEVAATELEKLQEILTLLNVSYNVNDRLVRGLDYYTNTVFEFIGESSNSQAGVLGGGGRYANLVKELGGPDLPGIGFGIGLDRVLLSMEKTNLDNSPTCCVCVIGEELQNNALELVKELRSSGISCDIDYKNKKLKQQLKYANQIKAKNFILLGEDEFKDNKVVVRQADTGYESIVGIENLVNYLKESEGKL